nr:immunoglobulin light chain junction region [Macaca mulatta]
DYYCCSYSGTYIVLF